MDAYGHVNNSNYFSYFESARIAWWQTVTDHYPSWIEVGPVIVTANCTFYKPIVYPQKLRIEVFVGKAGRSSYECLYRIYSADNEDLLFAEGTTTVVWVDRKVGKSVPLPEYIKMHLIN